jgi:hypothetical protein
VVQVVTRRREDLKFFLKSAVFIFKFKVLNLGRDDGIYFLKTRIDSRISDLSLFTI